MDKDLKKLNEELLKLAKEGKITCAQARKLAEELGLPYIKVGEAADNLNIKIHKCQLGCF
jgi:hypothetical protein